MNNKFLPPKDKFPLSNCSKPCSPKFTPTPLCEPLCNPYVFGPFTAPVTVYTYYEYPNTKEDFSLGCKDSCSNKHINTELKYSIYQIIDGVENFVGYWTIKDKDGPNKRKFEECGEYILRFCSSPPNECYPDCVHPDIPQFHISSCDVSNSDYEKVCLKHVSADIPVKTGWARHCSSCSDMELSISYFSQDGSVEYDTSDYTVVDCKTRQSCFLQDDGSIIKRIDSDGVFTYIHPNNHISSTPPINFSSSEEVLCPTPYVLEHEFCIIN